MAVRKLGSRNIRFHIGRALVKALPGLQSRMPYYDTVKLMFDVGRAQTITETLDVDLSPENAAFAAKLPDAPPKRFERSIALIAMDNVTVLGSTGVVVDEAREQLLTQRSARGYVNYHDFRTVLSSPVQKPEAIYFDMMGSHRGHAHYFHFMIDRLPRLYYLLNRFDLGREPVTVLTNTGLPAFQKDIYEFIQRRYPNIRFAAIPANERWRLRRLFHLDDHQPVKRTLADVKSFGIHPIIGVRGLQHSPRPCRGTPDLCIAQGRCTTPRRQRARDHAHSGQARV